MSSTHLIGQKMDKAVEALRRDFQNVRTGKASPQLLDVVRVEAYGSQVPLNQVASVSAPEPRLLVVQPWDTKMIGAIERGIQLSELGLNPSNDGKIVRIPVPALTEERRHEFVKILNKMTEEARVAIRQARKDSNDDIKRRQKDAEISEDQARREQDEVQKLTDQYVQKVEELLKSKVAEVLEV